MRKRGKFVRNWIGKEKQEEAQRETGVSLEKNQYIAKYAGVQLLNVVISCEQAAIYKQLYFQSVPATRKHERAVKLLNWKRSVFWPIRSMPRNDETPMQAHSDRFVELSCAKHWTTIFSRQQNEHYNGLSFITEEAFINLKM